MREKRPQATACLPVCQREEDEGVDLRIDAREGGGGRTELPERAEEFHPALACTRPVARQAWLSNNVGFSLYPHRPLPR